MDKPDLIIRSRRVVMPETVSPASVHIRDGVFAALGEWDEVPAQTPLVDAGDAVVMPGLVDAHVHINELGRTLCRINTFYYSCPTTYVKLRYQYVTKS